MTAPRTTVAAPRRRRPLHATALAAFCAATVVFLAARDLLLPDVRDTEVWLGFELHGLAARLTAPLHWAIFALGAWGFWRMRPWVWPWASGYALSIAVGHLVWNCTSEAGGGLVAGLWQLALFSIPAGAIWWTRPSGWRHETPALRSSRNRGARVRPRRTFMKAVKIIVIAALVYVGIVVAFESLIGILQPETGATLVITTTDDDGASHDRVVSRLEADGKLYVAANHWPRAWYRRAMENPDVSATFDDATADYHAVRVTGAEEDRVKATNPLPFFFRVLTGFPPRHIVRLDPRADEEAVSPEQAS